MKRLSSLFMMTTLIVVSCQIVDSTPSIPEKETKEIIISASLDNDPLTRTTHIDYKKVYWSPRDEIVVFSAGEASKFTSLNTVPEKAAKFKGQISVVSGVNDDLEGSYIWGLYPYRTDATLSNGLITTVLPDNQIGVADTFADDLLITMGRSLTFSIPFYHVCSGIRFTLTKSGVKSVTLKANGGEPVAGQFKAGIGEDGKPFIDSVIDPSSTVTVVAPNNGVFETGVWYYIITLPVSFSEGVTFTMRTENEKAKEVITTAFSLAQGSIYTSTELDNGLTYTTVCPTPENVDLGLSVKWATINLGATKPEEEGNYYAWGELEPRESYKSWNNYMWCQGSYNTLTKYCPTDMTSFWGGDGSPDNKLVLDLEDDVANDQLGGKWRMPTSSEFAELRRLTWTYSSGGYTLTAENGNSIFFPLTGKYNPYFDNDDSCCIWSSSLNSSKPYQARYFGFNKNGQETTSYENRFTAMPIRPVYDE